MTQKSNFELIKSSKRLVVKVGSKLLVDETDGKIRESWLNSLCEDIARWKAKGQELIIVSSGAIALGRRYLNLRSGDLKLEEKQAAAAAGMVRLAHAYHESLSKYNLSVAQILLTLNDSEDRRRYLNARSTINTLLSVSAVPLINENDTIATDEIRFGDNDRLAARVATMVSADLLILLSNIDGLYTSDPQEENAAQLLPLITEVTPEIEAMAGDIVSVDSSGGMPTKLAAAKQCLSAACKMVISEGMDEYPLKRLEDGANCSWFLPSSNPQTSRKLWIAGSLQSCGSIKVDAGATAALKDGSSLLPAGVLEVSGSFQRGDAITILDEKGVEIGRGLSAYSYADASKIKGHKTDEIASLLGFIGRLEMIHRDDLVIF